MYTPVRIISIIFLGKELATVLTLVPLLVIVKVYGLWALSGGK